MHADSLQLWLLWREEFTSLSDLTIEPRTLSDSSSQHPLKNGEQEARSPADSWGVHFHFAKLILLLLRLQCLCQVGREFLNQTTNLKPQPARVKLQKLLLETTYQNVW